MNLGYPGKSSSQHLFSAPSSGTYWGMIFQTETVKMGGGGEGNAVNGKEWVMRLCCSGVNKRFRRTHVPQVRFFGY